ncbi:MAG: radical SAM protein [Bacteroidales bacterium]|jgi:hypothetical protein|nr:radical SAM protein [Bacteroidales bacterium]
MKWQNKGHELDEMGSKISYFKKCIIFGAGTNGEDLYNGLHNYIDVIGFIDNNPSKTLNGYLGLPVYPVAEINNILDCETAVIISASSYMSDIIDQLGDYGLKYNVNLFDRRFYQIYMWYSKQMLCSQACAISVTERCTLNCRYCKVMIPYFRNPKDGDISVLKRDVDLFFNAFDYVCEFELFGGEPFLHPDLNELVFYIGENYKSRIGKIKVLTNGTVNSGIQDIFSGSSNRYGVRISVSDYTESLPNIKPSFEKFIENLQINKIEYEIRTRDKWWIDYGRETINRCDSSEDEMIELFDKCFMKCRLLKDGKYYNCQDDGFALKADFVEYDSGFSLLDFGKEDKMALLEYDYGYSEKGYVDLCRKCAGYLTINKNFVPVAEQVR